MQHFISTADNYNIKHLYAKYGYLIFAHLHLYRIHAVVEVDAQNELFQKYLHRASCIVFCSLILTALIANMSDKSGRLN